MNALYLANLTIMSYIIDVSSNNGDINWPSLKSQGVDDVIIRLSLGYNTLDSKAIDNANNANASAVKVSYYHFAYPDTKTGGTVISDATSEATYFLQLIKDNNLPSPRWYAVDLEWWEGGGDSPLSPSDYWVWLQNFLKTVYDNTGQQCLIYTGKSYFDTHLPDQDNNGNAIDYSVLPLWLVMGSNPNHIQYPKNWTAYTLLQYGNTAFDGKVFDINKLAT